jgi:hypothetical protein
VLLWRYRPVLSRSCTPVEDVRHGCVPRRRLWCLAVSRPSGRPPLQAKAKPVPVRRIFLWAVFSRSCRAYERPHSAAPPATKGDRRPAAVRCRARHTRPVAPCHPGCRCNQCRIPPSMGGEGACAMGSLQATWPPPRFVQSGVVRNIASRGWTMAHRVLLCRMHSLFQGKAPEARQKNWRSQEKIRCTMLQ